LLTNRIDMEQDRIAGSSPYLAGAKHVADIIRTLAVGINGRILPRHESELNEGQLTEKANRFFDALLDGFTAFVELANGTITAEQLRRTSLLGSVTMIRALAGVYYLLTRDGDDQWEEGDVSAFFASLQPLMVAPVTSDSPWMRYPSIFAEGASGPSARRQDIDRLVSVLVDMAHAWKADGEQGEMRELEENAERQQAA